MNFPAPKFFRPASFTVLVVFPHRLVRADFAGEQPMLERLWQADAPMGEALPVLADAAFSLGPHRKTQVYLLAGSFWTGVLPLSAAKAATLSNLELSQALGFEAEALSNISPFDSSLAAVPLATNEGERFYWVTQASRAELSAVEDTLFRRGARLAGFAHLAGLPRLLGHETGTPWERVELWGDYAVCLQRKNEQPLRLHVVGASPTQTGWLREASAWFGSGTNISVRQFLVAPGIPFVGEAGVTHDLNDESALKTWLGEWATELSGEARVPCLRPQSRPLTAQQRSMLTVSIAVATVLLCGLHWLWLQHREKVSLKELAIAQAPGKKLDDLKARTSAVEQRLTVARQELQTVTQLSTDWESVTQHERRRHLIMLEALAEASSDDFALQSLSEAGGEIRVSAIALRPELAEVTPLLADALKPLDWLVEAPRRKALNIAADGGPWELDWVLRPAVTTNAVPPAHHPAAVVASPELSPAARAAVSSRRLKEKP